MPKDVVLRCIDLLAAHKISVLHLHLTDDQGWRIEIKRYPRLTETGARRARTKVGLRDSPLWDERPHGGYYTQDDIREIVGYAGARHIYRPPSGPRPWQRRPGVVGRPIEGAPPIV